MRRLYVLLMCALLGWPAAPVIGGSPTTVPSSAEVDALITKLGDSNFRIRKEAARRLQQIGKPALPALRQATQSTDPEVRLRAQELLGDLLRRPVPDKPLDSDDDSTKITITAENGVQTIDVDDAGQKVRIRESDAGIEMTVTGEVDWEPATETYRAKNAEQLKESNPDAYALYQRWAGEIGPAFGAGRAFERVKIHRGPIVLPATVAAGDDLVALRHKLLTNMRAAKLPRDQMRRVLQAWADVRQERDSGRAQLDSGDRQMARYNRACDNLRSVLQDLHLPDPGELLPPPAGARLGVRALGGPDDNGPVTIEHVMPGSRAEKIGLQVNDVIERVNGEEVRGVKELRRLVTEHANGLVIEGQRAGQKLKLEEPHK